MICLKVQGFMTYYFFQVRYEYYNNCNFTEVGEPFAEQPYAVAVQQVMFNLTS